MAAVVKKNRPSLEQVAQRIANDPVVMARIREAEERMERGEGIPLNQFAQKVREARAKRGVALAGQAAISKKEPVHA